MYAVLLHSCVTAATGARLPWQKLRRTGEVERAVVTGGRTVTGGRRRPPAQHPPPGRRRGTAGADPGDDGAGEHDGPKTRCAEPEVGRR